MSYLEMPSCPLPDTNKMIISFWFRDVSEQQAKPREKMDWPQGFWTAATANTTMVPPNAQYSFGGLAGASGLFNPGDLGPDPAFKNCIDYWNAYGIPNGGTFFGNLFLTAACCWIPNPPPLALNTMGYENSPSSRVGDALTNMNKYGVRVLMAFGDPGIDYTYYSWRVEETGALPGVQLLPTPAGFLWWQLEEMSPDAPPYPPYNHKVGNDGKFKSMNYRLNASPTSKGKVPPCIIGIDERGHFFVNLQTKTQPTYKGMAFECTKVDTMWFWAAAGKKPRTDSAGHIIVDHSYIYYGPYWNGYQFKHKDVSQQIMGCCPDSFLLRHSSVLDIPQRGDVIIDDGGWHHVLLSFDISGAVSVKQNKSSDGTLTSTVSSGCNAWLSFDDANITGEKLQSKPPVHSGGTIGSLPKLRGTQTTDIFDTGPCVAMDRPAELGANGILPRNAWLKGYNGLPRDGCQWFVSNTPRIGDGGNLFLPFLGATVPIDDLAQRYGGIYGDFRWVEWTNNEWMLAYGAAGPPLIAKFDPMHPDPAGDPSKFATPSYDGSGYTIPLAGHPIAIPAGSSQVGIGGTASLSDYNSGVEMAELQIWVDKSIDAGSEAMRRLFLDYPTKVDDKGNKVPDKSKPLQPVSPKVAEKALGKPDIKLHGSSAWRRGRNTGSSGGQFQPVAGIEKFLPNPKLNE